MPIKANPISEQYPTCSAKPVAQETKTSQYRHDDLFSERSQFFRTSQFRGAGLQPSSSGKTNAVIEMKLEKLQASRTIRSRPALQEIKSRHVDRKVILANQTQLFRKLNKTNQDTSICHDYLFLEEATFLWGMQSCSRLSGGVFRAKETQK